MQAPDEILPNRLGAATILDCPTDLGIPSQTARITLQLDGIKARRLEFHL